MLTKNWQETSNYDWLKKDISNILELSIPAIHHQSKKEVWD